MICKSHKPIFYTQWNIVNMFQLKYFPFILWGWVSLNFMAAAFLFKVVPGVKVQNLRRPVLQFFVS